jgi:ABC-type phosphate/phosphonate transport system permease subunit
MLRVADIPVADIVTVVVLALAVSAASMTLTKAKLFSPIRDRIDNRSEWFGELVGCPYCMSHWLAFAATAVYQPRIVHSGTELFDYFVTALAIVALAAFSSGLIFRAFSGVD